MPLETYTCLRNLLYLEQRARLPEFFGIDTEASASGTERTQSDIHTIQVCSSQGEHTGKCFWNAQDFKEWYRHKKPRPKIFYAFTLGFEYGTLAAWELLNASTENGDYPWQNWTEEPINLFYISIDQTRIPVFDVRLFFYQLRIGNNALTNLRAVGDYLSDFYAEDICKLTAPLGEDFGKRPPNPEERPYFEKYGIRDSYICAKAAQWVHSNVMEKWLENRVPIQKIFSWGTVAKHYFDLPKIAQVTHYGKKTLIEFPNQWHRKIFESTFAGRSEAFLTGNIGQTFYNDVSALYPTCIIQTQCIRICDVEEWPEKPDGLYGKINWKKFYNATGFPYGWILGDFKTESDLWALPIKMGENNWYITGTLKNRLYNSLDLEASNAEVLDVQTVLTPVFTNDPAFLNPMRKYEELTKIKLTNAYRSEIESHCIKSTINSTSGILGKSHPTFGATTNLPSYNILLGQSHLFMSQIFHRYHTPEHPIAYIDTDSLFWHKPLNVLIRECEAYPDLPFQVLETLPLRISVKGESRPEGTIIFRGKMYFQSENSLAFSAWKPFPQYFAKIIKQKPQETTIERQITRKWRTRNKKAITLKIGRWYIQQDHWNLEKLKEIFRADNKRCRPTYDSYQLFLDGKSVSSRAWTAKESLQQLAETPWTVRTQ